MSQPVPEEENAAYDVTEPPPGEHDDDLAGPEDADLSGEPLQEENAGTTLDQPSQ